MHNILDVLVDITYSCPKCGCVERDFAFLPLNRITELLNVFKDEEILQIENDVRLSRWCSTKTKMERKNNKFIQLISDGYMEPKYNWQHRVRNELGQFI